MGYSRLLRYTSPMIHGDDVKEVQAKLNELDYSCGNADGYFGSQTDNAARSFQKDKGLTVDGIIGLNTWNALFGAAKSSNMQISDNGAAFIAEYEGFSEKAYRGADSQNYTIGYGHVIIHGDGLTKDSILTNQQALDLLKKDLQSRVRAVNKLAIDIKLNQNQFDSLVSFQYNTGGLANSTLLKDIKAGADLETIKVDFCMWIHCNGVVLEGLKKRRMDEWEMYACGDYKRTR